MNPNENQSVTMQELLAVEPLINAKILSGWSGKYNKITEIVDTTSKNTCQKNSLFFLQTTDKYLEDVEFALDNSTSAILLTGHRQINLPSSFIKKANEKSIPIIHYSSEYSIKDLEFSFSLIKNLKRHNNLLLFAENSIFKMFTKVNQIQLLDSCGKLLNAPLIFVNKAFQFINCSCHNDYHDETNHDLVIINQISQHEKNNWYRLKNVVPITYSRSVVLQDGTKLDYLLLPLISENYLYGFLISLINNKMFTDIDKLLIEQLGQVMLEQLIHRKNIEQIEKKYKADFIHDLLFNNFESKEQLIERGEFWGYNLAVPQQLILIEPDTINELVNIAEILEKIQLILIQTISSFKQPIISDFQGQVVIIIPTENYHDIKEYKKNIISLSNKLLKKLTSTLPKINFSIGIGRFYNSVADICRSYQEAKNALALGKLIHEESHVTHFEDLGVMRLLANLSYEQLEDYYKEYLGDILEYDQKNNANMLATLYMYFKQDGDINRTAENLFIHPNSLRYRLKKIEELTERSLQDYEDSLNLFIACKIARMRSHNLDNLF